MIFEVLAIFTVIYSCNTVSGLYEVIIKKLCNCTLLRYDNIVFLKNNIINLLCFTMEEWAVRIPEIAWVLRRC